jgi:hypothetical protein
MKSSKKGPSVQKKVGMFLDSMQEKPMKQAPKAVTNQHGTGKSKKEEPKKKMKAKEKA